MEAERTHGFYGFHGTVESCAVEIDKSQYFELGEPRPDHWLGQGVYFYREDEEQAFVWAKKKVEKNRRFSGQLPRVIEVFLEAKESNFLNLDTRTGLIRLLVFFDQLKKQGLTIEGNEDIERLPAKIRSFLLSLLPETIWMIQRTFKVEKSIFDGSKLFMAMEINLVGTQICVRNHNVIKKGTIRLLDKRSIKKLPKTVLGDFKLK